MTSEHERCGARGAARRAMGRGLAVPIAVALAACAGCSTKLLRENVLATTQSAIGVSLAQNAQTQMYELKAGFFRNEFFLVPTSKRVVNDADNRDAAGTTAQDGRLDKLGRIEHNDPSATPEVLAEIQVGGVGKQSLREQSSRVEVYQRLAVGKHAVESRAAVALMASDAETARALAAARASGQVSANRAAALTFARTTLEARAQRDPEAARVLADLERVAREIVPPVAVMEEHDFVRSENQALQLVRDEWTVPIENGRFRGLADATEFLNRAARTVEALEAAEHVARGTSSPAPVEGLESGMTADECAAVAQRYRQYIQIVTEQITRSPAFRRALEAVFGLADLCQ